MAGQTGDTQRQLELNLEAAQALAQVRAFGDLLTVLSNLGLSEQPNADAHLAQAIWLSLRIQAALENAVLLLRVMFNRVPQGDLLEALTAAAATFRCAQQAEHPKIQEMQTLSLQMLSTAAGNQGITTEAELVEWFQENHLNDPNYFIPALSQRLETMIGDTWLFDQSRFGSAV
ncbi:MAG: hypothetical protein HC805_07750 [Alkalinema sp. RL_2_19]|nr:hypothetical protein [Alkalinema sp. RL_2_19]